VQYYPFQVKGYQNTYPKRRVAVVGATDDRDFKDAGVVDHRPSRGFPAIGAVFDQNGKLIEKLYGPDLDLLFQNAISSAAAEAGMQATPADLPLKRELAVRKADYVMTAKVLRCWVTKTRGPDTGDGPSWHAVADVALDASIYKPPFDVAFWEAQVAATYNDPPGPVSGVGVGDEAEIYDQPGEVLSVAMTRAVAQIFKRDDLHTLVEQDTIRFR
jgi:hypothetical protein